jgi:hypothetical protein
MEGENKNKKKKKQISTSSRTLVDNLDDTRRPLFKLHRPVRDGGERYDDKERSVLLLAIHEETDQRDGLNGFAETLKRKKKKK